MRASDVAGVSAPNARDNAGFGVRFSGFDGDNNEYSRCTGIRAVHASALDTDAGAVDADGTSAVTSRC